MNPVDQGIPLPLNMVAHPFAMASGDAATWVGSISQAAAVIAAVIAGAIAYRLYLAESKRDELAAEDRRLAAEDRRRADQDRAMYLENERQAQASRVAAWFGRRQPEYPRDLPAFPGMWFYGASVRNASSLPITNVEVVFHAIDTNADPEASVDSYTVDEATRVVAPGDEVFVRMHWPDPSLGDDREFAVEIAFTDAARRRWRRDWQGALQPVDL